ncbi:MAG: matrixin family metalloprotease [Deltaproteobacteria bacterium]|nr:matrixin family metalloprotease [Deltaproteobacteria bacterium]
MTAMRWVIVLMSWTVWLGGWTLLDSSLKGWEQNPLSVRMNYTECTISRTVLDRIIDDSFALWNAAPTAKIKLERSSEESTTTPDQFLARSATDSPLILCDASFGSHLSTDPDQVPAATWIPTPVTTLDYGAILLNGQAGRAAEISQLSEAELFVVIAHELGHLLGLGHSQDSAALMYYSINGKTKAVLSQDDLDGLTYVYPRNELSSGPFGCAAVHTSDNDSRLSWFLPWVLLLVAVLMTRIKLRPLL